MMNISPFYLMNIPVTVGNYKPQLTFIQVGNYLDGLLKMIKMNWKDYWRGLLLFLYSFCLLCYWYIWIIHPIRTEIASPITFWNKNAQFYISGCKLGVIFVNYWFSMFIAVRTGLTELLIKTDIQSVIKKLQEKHPVRHLLYFYVFPIRICLVPTE